MSIKRTIITTVLALALVAVAVPGVSLAVDNTAAINAALAQIASLQAQLNLLQGSTAPAQTPGNCTGVTFARTLVIGSTGSDVKCLQTILNLSSTTQVAITGAGSPGSETAYFGSLTLSAVRKYQVQHGWTPANQVGPMTRQALNASLAGGVVVPPITTTALCPNGNTVASSCTLAPNAQATAALCPNGNTLASNCSLAPSAQATTGLTGFIDASTLAAAPASDANVTVTSSVPVLGVNIKAINSNMTVNSLKVQLAVTKSAAAEHPATLVNKLYVYDGSTLLGTFPVNTNTVYKTAASEYYVILSGFNFVVPANTTKVLTINADFAPALETDRVLTINLFATDSVGAIDGTGATRTGGVITTRVYTVNYDSVGTSTLTGTANTSTPVSSSVNINTTSGTTDVPMLVFNAKSTVGASVLTDLIFTATGDNTAVAKMTAVKLYDGSTLLGSKSLSSAVSGATATFTDLAIAIAKDQTKTLTVKADFAADVTSGSSVQLTITPTTQFEYTTPNLSAGVTTSSGSIITGKLMYLYDGQAATFSLVSATSTYTPSPATASAGTTTGVITLKVHAAGGSITKPVAADFTVLAYTNGVSVGAAASKYITVTPDEAVSDGTDATVVINVSEPISTSGNGFVNFGVTNIKWVVSDGTTTTTVTNQTWGLTDFVTPVANAQ